MYCNTCNTVHTKDSFKEQNCKALTKAILNTFAILNGRLCRQYRNDVAPVTPNKLYTLTGGRRVTHNMVMRVLNGESLYAPRKSKKDNS